MNATVGGGQDLKGRPRLSSNIGGNLYRLDLGQSIGRDGDRRRNPVRANLPRQQIYLKLTSSDISRLKISGGVLQPSQGVLQGVRGGGAQKNRKLVTKFLG